LSERVRAGASAPSEARPAQMAQALYMHKFDQHEAQRLTGLKGVIRNPLASRPLITGDEVSADIAFGHTGQVVNVSTPAPGMQASAGPLPNTTRAVPAPWDSDLYAAIPSSAGRRFNGRRR
jgi:hypothetical protein